MKKALIQTLCELMSQNENVYLFTGDLGFGVMDPILEHHNNRFINAGICEQNMLSAATGMAMEGNIVFVYSIGNFPTLRCMEQIRNDASYHNANVKIIAVGGGFAYGQLGMSHHATEDVAMLRSVPNITILTPADSVETVEAVKLAATITGPVYIRLGRGGEKCISHKQLNIKLPMNLDITNKEITSIKIALLGSGIVMPDVEEAAKELAKDYKVVAYSLCMIKPCDEQTIEKICYENDFVFTIEEHQIIGGLGSLVAEIIAEKSILVKFKRIGMKNQFTKVVGSPSYLRKVYGLDRDGIIKTVKEVILENK